MARPDRPVPRPDFRAPLGSGDRSHGHHSLWKPFAIRRALGPLGSRCSRAPQALGSELWRVQPCQRARRSLPRGREELPRKGRDVLVALLLRAFVPRAVLHRVERTVPETCQRRDRDPHPEFFLLLGSPRPVLLDREEAPRHLVGHRPSRAGSTPRMAHSRSAERLPHERLCVLPARSGGRDVLVVRGPARPSVVGCSVWIALSHPFERAERGRAPSGTKALAAFATRSDRIRRARTRHTAGARRPVSGDERRGTR